MNFPCICVSFFFFLSEKFPLHGMNKKNETNGSTSYGDGIIVEMQFLHKNKMFWFLSHSFVFFFSAFLFSSIINRHYVLFALLDLYTQNLLISVVFFYVVFSHHGYIRLFNSSFYVFIYFVWEIFYQFFSFLFCLDFHAIPLSPFYILLIYESYGCIFFLIKFLFILIKCHFP